MVKTTETRQKTPLELEEENASKFLNMLASIEPVKAEYSSEEMVAMLRTGQEQQLLDSKKAHTK